MTSASQPGWEGSDDIIQEGDLLHIDWGITAMGMNTDTQHLSYVLRSGETDAPDGLKAGLRKANRMQEIALEELRPGLTGNQVLQRCLDRMKSEGIEGQMYSHPIGDWGHDAGAVVGKEGLYLRFDLLLIVDPQDLRTFQPTSPLLENFRFFRILTTA